jgi:hypothetical protein
MKRHLSDLERRKKALGRVYFTDETEQAIIKYNKCEDDLYREKIFREDIHPALDKLAENIINRFKFPYMDGSFDDIKNQVVSFLVLNLHKFNPEKYKDTGRKVKAFSYFSVVAKNYLILHNNNAYREETKRTYLAESATEESFHLEEVLSIEPEFENSKSEARGIIELLVQYWDFNLDKIFKKQRDKHIANAVVELLRRADTIENFNKKALYINIREMTDCKTVHITKVLKKMKSHVNKQLEIYHATGHFSDPSSFFVYKNRE